MGINALRHLAAYPDRAHRGGPFPFPPLPSGGGGAGAAARAQCALELRSDALTRQGRGGARGRGSLTGAEWDGGR